MKELTRAEEQVMQVLWKRGKGFVNDILKEFSEPKPAYNTISTIIRILEKKGFVQHKSFGRSHEYHPVVTKKEYRKAYFNGFLKRYFNNSAGQFASFFTQENDVSVEELEEIKA